MQIFIPDAAREILRRLESSGYSAYIVGGAVRDALMGRVADDFDIATSASPEETKRIFSDLRTVDTGLRHGTVTVIAEGASYEVTTYRIDGDYEDFRHPDGVSFTDRIEDDLARRDFTVNAIAYSPMRGICDPYFGRVDLEERLIRAVGKPEIRFREDALRILRALRFSSTLGFAIENDTKRALRDAVSLLSKVSSERVLVEWKKLLSGKNAYSVIEEFGDVISFVIPELKGARLPNREAFERLDMRERMLALHATSGGSEGFLSAMKNLHSDNCLRKFGLETLETIIALEAFSEESIARCYIKYSKEAILSAIRIASALGIADSLAVSFVEKLIAMKVPSTLGELSVGGEDMISIGIYGESIGKTLSSLLLFVVLGRIENERDKLIALAQSMKDSYNSNG